MPQFDRTTMRFVVTIALLYCALIASGFRIFFGVACTVAGTAHSPPDAPDTR